MYLNQQRFVNEWILFWLYSVAKSTVFLWIANFTDLEKY
jgi:hypothetical protein